MPVTEPRAAGDVGVRDILAARRRLHGIARVTPLEHSPWLSELAGQPVHLKLECWQRTGSFKLRGACNAVAALDGAALGRGVVAASAGNHGQGVALAARSRRVSATIFVPADAPATKKSRIRGFGAELREASSYDEAAERAAAFAAETGAAFIDPCADPAVVAGQGTVGMEIAESLPGLTDVVVPVGGGGLIAGVGLAVGALTDGRARIHGVQTERARVMHDSLEAGRVLPPPPHESTLADGLAGGIDAVSLARVRSVARSLVLVSEAEIAAAIRELYRHHGIVAEGAGAVVVAAVAGGHLSLTGPSVLVISGGNIDGVRLGGILMEDEWRAS